MQLEQQKLYAKKLRLWLLGGLIVTLGLAPVLQQSLDIYLNFRWAQGLAEGFFNAYDGHVYYLDYPPLCFPVLWLVGKIDQWFGLAGNNAMIQLSLKVMPVCFYMLSTWTVYLIACRYTEPKRAYHAALFLLLCPTLFVNSVYWGQVDTVLIFFILWFFYHLDEGRPLAATVVLVLGCVMKLQTLFFLPIFVAYMVYRYPIKKVLVCGVTGVALAYALFIPFMIPRLSALYAEAAGQGLSFFPALTQAIGSSLDYKDGVALPFNLYFGSYNSYQYAAMNSFNLWSAVGMNMERDVLNAPIISGIGWLTPKFLGNIFLGVSVLLPMAYAVAAKFKKWQADVWMLAFLTMQSIYMFAAMMHDRYQIAVLPLLLMLWVRKKDYNFAVAFVLTAVMTCANHLMTIISYTSNELQQFFFYGAGSMIYIVFSLFNLALYAYTVYICRPYLFKPEQPVEAAEGKEE